jgi:hypothetical protein
MCVARPAARRCPCFPCVRADWARRSQSIRVSGFSTRYIAGLWLAGSLNVSTFPLGGTAYDGNVNQFGEYADASTASAVADLPYRRRSLCGPAERTMVQVAQHFNVSHLHLGLANGAYWGTDAARVDASAIVSLLTHRPFQASLSTLSTPTMCVRRAHSPNGLSHDVRTRLNRRLLH